MRFIRAVGRRFSKAQVEDVEARRWFAGGCGRGVSAAGQVCDVVKERGPWRATSCGMPSIGGPCRTVKSHMSAGAHLRTFLHSGMILLMMSVVLFLLAMGTSDRIADDGKPDIRAEVMLKAIAKWPGDRGLNPDNLALTGKSPWLLGGVSPVATVESGWSDEEAEQRLRPELLALAAGEPRTIVNLGPARRLTAGGGVRVFVYNPIVRGNFAFVEGDHSATGAYLYVFEWRERRWVPVATLLGPSF